MKKFFALCGIVATLFAACEPVENGNDATPTFEIKSKTEISVGAGSTMGIIQYELVNPVEGATIEATADVEWIGSFDYSQMGKIGYKVEANASYDVRQGIVTISYNGYTKNISFTQAGKARPNEIALTAELLHRHYDLTSGSEAKVIESPYFTMVMHDVAGEKELDRAMIDSFVIYIAIKGDMNIIADGVAETLKEGEVVLIPAEMGDIRIEGTGRVMEVYIGK